MKAIGVIPSRYASTRLPGKALADILGKPMIQRVYEQAIQSKLLETVIVATDDQRIFDTVKSFGGEAAMTSKDCPTGLHRVAELAQKLPILDTDIVVNIQGDEPVIHPKMIDQIIQPFFDDASTQVCQLIRRINAAEIYSDTNRTKTILATDGTVLYRSRASIPGSKTMEWNNQIVVYRSFGILAQRKGCLVKLYGGDKNKMLSNLESIEDVNILRYLENRVPIKAIETQFSSISVDTPEDLEKARKFFN